MNRQTQLIICLFCILKLLLHLVADSHSGFQGDELLHIETGKHLAFGYMEFPPFIGFLAFLQNLFASNSVLVHHLFSHLASILVLIFVSKTTIELGGKNKAVFLVLLGIIVAPSFGRSQQLFQPVVFSQLLWVLAFYSLVKFVKYLDKKSLWQLTFFCILGFLTKYDALFFIFGLTTLLFFERTRKALFLHKFWMNVFVFGICIIPNIVWQAQNDFPVLQMFSRLYETQLDKTGRLKNLFDLLIAINPIVTILLFLTGVFNLFKSRFDPKIFPLAISIALSFLFLLFKNGKAYYFFPLVLTILPFGAILLETQIIKKKKWAIYPISVLLLLGALLIPFGMPIYGFDRYLDRIYPIEAKHIEIVKGGKYSVQYEEYYSKEKWQTTIKEIKSVFDSLSTVEKNNCLIWGKHYAQAGAMNLFGKEHNLPKAFSYHGSFYSWTPKGEMPKTIIALSYRVGDFFSPYFEEVTLVRTIYNPYSDNEEALYQKIYICKEPRQNFYKMKELFKHRIFE